jgi:hypothetical protein
MKAESSADAEQICVNPHCIFWGCVSDRDLVMEKTRRVEGTARKWVTKRVRSACKLKIAQLSHCVPGNKEDSNRKGDGWDKCTI